MAKYFEGELWVQYDALTEEKVKYRRLMDTCDNQNAELFHANSHIEQLHNWIKSDSVLKALDYLRKNEHHFDLPDDEYMNLYRLCIQLRKLDEEDNESRIDDFHQKLP